MNPLQQPTTSFPLGRFTVTTKAAIGLVLFCINVQSHAQGTMTFTFEGQPAGTMAPFSDMPQGMLFQATPFGALYLSGGGVAPYPDNGTGNLVIPENGDPHGGLEFRFTNITTFNLVSFDAAEYFNSGATNFTVIGYKPMAGTVTNIFTTQVATWQTFDLDSSFQNLFRVEIYASSFWGRFSMDNLVISGVPEPSAGGLILLGTLCGLGWRWTRRSRFSRSNPSVRGG